MGKVVNNMDQEKKKPKWITGLFGLDFSVLMRLFQITPGCYSFLAFLRGFRNSDTLKKNSNIWVFSG